MAKFGICDSHLFPIYLRDTKNFMTDVTFFVYLAEMEKNLKKSEINCL